MMSSSPSDLSFLSVLSSTPSNDMGLDTTYSFSPDADFGDLMMSPFMKHSQDFNVTMNSMLTSTTLPTIMPMVNLPPLSPESDNGSFAESVMSSSSSQPSSSSQQRSDNEYHSPHHDEPLSPLPDDYFTNMAQLQAQAQQQAQQQQQQQQTTGTVQQQQQLKPVVSILHTTPPTTPTEKPTLLNHLSVSIPPTTTSIPTSTPTETKPTKKRKSRSVKVEPTSPDQSSSHDGHEDDDDVDIAIDPNLPPDVIRELLQEQSLKKKRLARKAELARMSRKRKKTRMGDLELECERLHAEIDRLRKMRRLDMEDAANKQQQAVAAAQAAATTSNQMMKEEDGKFIFDSRRWIDVSDHQKAVADTIQAMADAARTIQGQEDTTYMGKLHETFVTTFNRQMVAGEGHITALENHLSPCMPLQFLQWVMSQPDKFCQDTSGLWNSLFQAEIGVTSDQMCEIMALRTTVKKQRKVQVDVEKAYKKLSHCLRRQMSQSNENLTKLRSILSPLQLAKYFDWVNRFGHVCVKINL